MTFQTSDRQGLSALTLHVGATPGPHPPQKTPKWLAVASAQVYGATGVADLVGVPHSTIGNSQATVKILEFLPEGSGTGFLHKKRVPETFLPPGIMSP